jgi:hypothetical protein
MIKRTYFVSAKMAHNNNTGKYSYWNGVMNIKSWLPLSADDLVICARGMAHNEITPLLERSTDHDDVELLALNEI